MSSPLQYEPSIIVANAEDLMRQRFELKVVRTVVEIERHLSELATRMSGDTGR